MMREERPPAGPYPQHLPHMRERGKWRAIVIRRLDVLQAVMGGFSPWPAGLCLITPPAVGASLGIGWALEIQKLVPKDIPFIIDCDDRAGDALAALRGGARHILCPVSGQIYGQRAKSLAALCAEAGAHLWHERPDYFADYFDWEGGDYRSQGLKRLLEMAEAWYGG